MHHVGRFCRRRRRSEAGIYREALIEGADLPPRMCSCCCCCSGARQRSSNVTTSNTLRASPPFSPEQGTCSLPLVYAISFSLHDNLFSPSHEDHCLTLFVILQKKLNKMLIKALYVKREKKKAWWCYDLIHVKYCSELCCLFVSILCLDINMYSLLIYSV